MTHTTHTAACQTATTHYATTRAAWDAAWPNACDTCHGAGGAGSSYDPSPAGVALSPGSMYDYDPCPDCIDEGNCPRCGAPAYADDTYDGPCPGCGWDHGRGREDGAPEPPECFCWLQDEPAYVP